MVTLKYNEISSFGFTQAMQKILNTPTHGARASVFHKIGKVLTRAQTEMRKEFQDTVVEAWAEKDADGKIIRPEGEPTGFTPKTGQEDAFLAAQQEFGQKTVDLHCQPITIEMLSDIKVSAQDLEALAGMYVGNHEEKPQLAVAK